MIKYYNGDLLKSGCDIICHQVNLQGIMGGGLARQIAEKYPQCEKQYNKVYELNQNQIKLLLGQVDIYYDKMQEIIICNCFSQEENFDTNYNAVKSCFEKIKDFALKSNLKTIGIPKNYGCGIAYGEWKKIEAIFKELFENEQNTELQIWKL